MSYNAHELSNRLLNALDSNYNVINMHAVNEIISILERFNITKELLETTRLGKHVNELRRKTSDPVLARRAKVLVKRWRDLVIPAVVSPAQTGSNRTSAERQPRRLGGTPLTSPALSRQVFSPRLPARPAWGGYESDSQDVILVDDEPDPPAPPAAPTAAPPPRRAAASPAPPAPRRPTPVASPALPPLPRRTTPVASPALPPLPAPGPSTLSNAAHKPTTPPAVKRPAASTEPQSDEKSSRRDKKLKKRRGYGRAGAAAADGGAAAVGGGTSPPPPPGAPAAWAGRNGAHADRRRNGCRAGKPDPYTALVNRIPKAGDKKVKTTKELLEEIQSRGSRLASCPASPAASPGSPDVLLVGEEPAPAASPLRNGGSPPPPAQAATPPPPQSPPRPQLEEPREYAQCTCGEREEQTCPARAAPRVWPAHVHALHHALLPGVNGTRAPRRPHPFPVRKIADPERPGLFASVVPLYKYTDYADDECVKNMSRLPLCEHLPWTSFAPPPPDPPPPPSPPPPRPYPLDPPQQKPADDDDDEDVKPDPSSLKIRLDPFADSETPDSSLKIDSPGAKVNDTCAVVVKMEVDAPDAEMDVDPVDRLSAPPSPAEAAPGVDAECAIKVAAPSEFASIEREHRTVERTKERDGALDWRALCERDGTVDGRALCEQDSAVDGRAPCERAGALCERESALCERDGALDERVRCERDGALDGRALYLQCERALAAAPHGYECVDAAPLLPLPLPGDEEGAARLVRGALHAAAGAAGGAARDELGRPRREPAFAEWHECVQLGSLVVMPYVVID